MATVYWHDLDLLTISHLSYNKSVQNEKCPMKAHLPNVELFLSVS